MSRYIDADKIEYTERYVGMDEFAGWQTIAFKSDIDKIPTADVVEVVRCKDCAFYRDETSCCLNPRCVVYYYGHRVREDHYCSYGERRCLWKAQ
jgi:hypothetical protein